MYQERVRLALALTEDEIDEKIVHLVDRLIERNNSIDKCLTDICQNAYEINSTVLGEIADILNDSNIFAQDLMTLKEAKESFK